jgi:DHA1 family multidrug resistance protein-like MFS transporter
MTTFSSSGSIGGSGGAGRRQLQLAIVCAAQFVVWSGFSAILPYLPVFLREQAHASLWLIGVIASAYFVGSFAFAAPLGTLSDRIGRKPVIVAGMWLYAVASLLFVTTAEPAWFICFRLLQGVGAAAMLPAGQAFIADITTDEARSRAYGWFATAQFGGMIVGPALAIPLYALGGGHGTWAFYTIFLCGSALAAISAVMIMVAVHDVSRSGRRKPGEAKRPPLKTLVTRPVGAFLIIALTGQLSVGAWEVLWSIWLRDLHASMGFIGLTWILPSVPLLFAFAFGTVADRHSRWALMYSGYAISGVTTVYYGVSHDLKAIMVVLVLEGFAWAWAFPAKQAFLVQVSPPRSLGAIQGLEGGVTQLAAFVGTLCAPALYALMKGLVLSVFGLLYLVALAVTAPTLLREWRRLASAGESLSHEEAERLAAEHRPAPVVAINSPQE